MKTTTTPSKHTSPARETPAARRDAHKARPMGALHVRLIPGAIRRAALAALLLALAACTTNNGDIGPLMGQWRVTEIACDGLAEPDYDGSLFFAFQSDVFLMRQVLAPHATTQDFGRFSDDGHGQIAITFPEERYAPRPCSHLSKDATNILSYTRVDAGGFTLTLHATDTHTYTYRLVKW